MKELKVLVWAYPLFSLSIGWALISWMLGSLQLRWGIVDLHTKSFVVKEFL